MRAAQTSAMACIEARRAGRAARKWRGIADRETDHQHDEQIDRAADAAERRISQGHDQPGGQD
jgi:hypothetical protein